MLTAIILISFNYLNFISGESFITGYKSSLAPLPASFQVTFQVVAYICYFSVCSVCSPFLVTGAIVKIVNLLPVFIFTVTEYLNIYTQFQLLCPFYRNTVLYLPW